MTLAKEADKEKDAPKAREAIYLLLDLVSIIFIVSIISTVSISEAWQETEPNTITTPYSVGFVNAHYLWTGFTIILHISSIN